MARYVDGFVLPIRKRNIEAYRKLSRMAGKVWRDHGALEYVEAVGEDLAPKGATPFTSRIKPKPGETLIFAFIVYKSRAHRDRVNARVMKDPRIARQMGTAEMPFDPKRMLYGGFQAIVDL